ncbi:hypothetical protein BC939DRAFT_475416 [Gamsiella multidivaricata]|uniref:uncharacterized protein n=1 Tax=Gamsiella multidivaricata TaxID=101098 RepID=UPI00221EF4F6|nr:uncharacterized protein BC939DRAFT_475416 [Gamsiella multidivaricata]KAI7827043.1 hypothetical protein BC939DRAFT_475416 [Gamsiella multidivaricata]
MYDTWRRNYGDAFWASQSAVLRIETSTKRAVKEIVEGSDHVRIRFIRQYVRGEMRSPLATYSPGSIEKRTPIIVSSPTLPPLKSAKHSTTVEVEFGSKLAQSDSNYDESNPSCAEEVSIDITELELLETLNRIEQHSNGAEEALQVVLDDDTDSDSEEQGHCEPLVYGCIYYQL